MMLVEIALDKIESNPWQNRKEFREEELLQLGESIKKEGLLQAIGLRKHPAKKGVFQIIWGERRWRASRLVGLTTIKAEILSATDVEMKKHAVLENRNRKDTNPVEDARGTVMLLDTGMKFPEIAKTVGRRESELREELVLLDLPEELQGEVIRGGLSKRLGIAIGKLPKHQHMEVYKATLGRTLKAQMNYIYAIEMQNRKIELFTLTAEDKKGLVSVRAKWEKFKAAFNDLAEVKVNVLSEVVRQDPAAVFFMDTVASSMKRCSDQISKDKQLREFKEERRQKNVKSA